MTQNERWNLHYQQVLAFIQKNKRIPSKHRIEEHKLLNWLKYNRKLIAQQKLDSSRAEKFRELTELGSQYHRINQYAYVETD